MTPRLLLVEDEPSLARGLADSFRDEGYASSSAVTRPRPRFESSAPTFSFSTSFCRAAPGSTFCESFGSPIPRYRY